MTEEMFSCLHIWPCLSLKPTAAFSSTTLSSIANGVTGKSFTGG